MFAPLIRLQQVIWTGYRSNRGQFGIHADSFRTRIFSKMTSFAFGDRWNRSTWHLSVLNLDSCHGWSIAALTKVIGSVWWVDHRLFAGRGVGGVFFVRGHILNFLFGSVLIDAFVTISRSFPVFVTDSFSVSGDWKISYVPRETFAVNSISPKVGEVGCTLSPRSIVERRSWRCSYGCDGFL